MSFALPPQTHKARELIGDVAHVAALLDPAKAAELPVTWQAVRSAREAFAQDGLKPSRITYIVLRCDSGERWLISVGPKGGWRKEWNFGNGRPS